MLRHRRECQRETGAGDTEPGAGCCSSSSSCGQCAYSCSQLWTSMGTSTQSSQRDSIEIAQARLQEITIANLQRELYLCSVFTQASGHARWMSCCVRGEPGCIARMPAILPRSATTTMHIYYCEQSSVASGCLWEWHVHFSSYKINKNTAKQHRMLKSFCCHYWTTVSLFHVR